MHAHAWREILPRMSNAKTVSLIDHEIRQLREAVMIHIERIDLTVAELRAAVERLQNQGGGVPLK